MVLFDSHRDLAVLYVPSLRTPALLFDDTATRGDQAVAGPSFAEAIAHDPFGIESACRVLPGDPAAAAAPASAQGAPLCDAAKKRADPDLGRE